MFKKINREKGFTLAELLVVVAIIGVLVAVSIPVFSGQLDKSRAAVDAANVRAAKASAAVEYLTSEGSIYYYDSSAGNVKVDSTGIKGYGKSTTDIDLDEADNIPKDAIVKVVCSDDGTMKAEWVSSNGGGSPSTPEAVKPIESLESYIMIGSDVGQCWFRYYKDNDKSKGIVDIPATMESGMQGGPGWYLYNITVPKEKLKENGIVLDKNTIFNLTEPQRNYENTVCEFKEDGDNVKIRFGFLATQ